MPRLTSIVKSLLKTPNQQSNPLKNQQIEKSRNVPTNIHFNTTSKLPPKQNIATTNINTNTNTNTNQISTIPSTITSKYKFSNSVLKNSPSKYANKDKYTNVKHHTKRRRRTGSIVSNNRMKSVFFKYVKSDKINKKVIFPYDGQIIRN